MGIKSSFLNSELTKLVTLVVKDVRINKRIASDELSNETPTEKQNQNILDFREKKVPHFINSFAQVRICYCRILKYINKSCHTIFIVDHI